MIKKIIFIILAFLSTFAYADKEIGVVEEQKQGELRVSTILTLSSMDCFFRMLPNDVFFLNQHKAYMGESFRYLPLFDFVVENNGDDYNLECSMYMTKLDTGDMEPKRQVLLDKYVIEGKIYHKEYTLFFPTDMFLSFSPTDEFGLHRIDFEVYNTVTKERVFTQSEVLFEEWKTPDFDLTKEEIDSFIFAYNTNFDKQRMYASLLSKGLNFYKKTGYNGFNPMLISYYKHTFLDNRFLLDILYDEFKYMDTQKRQKVIMLNAFLGVNPFAKELLTSEELIFQNYIEGEFDFNLDPYEGELRDSFSFEILWGEFFARGNYRPLERLMELFKHDDAYAWKVFKKEALSPSTQAELSEYKLGSLRILLNNYLSSYLSNPILRRYVVWTFENTKDEKTKEALSLLLNVDKENKENKEK